MKRLKLIGCLVVLAAIVGVNVRNAIPNTCSLDLNFDEVEAVGQVGEPDKGTYSTDNCDANWADTGIVETINGKRYAIYLCRYILTWTGNRYCDPAAGDSFRKALN